MKVEAKYEEIKKLVVEFLTLAREQGETVTGPMYSKWLRRRLACLESRISKPLKDGYFA